MPATGRRRSGGEQLDNKRQQDHDPSTSTQRLGQENRKIQRHTLKSLFSFPRSCTLRLDWRRRPLWCSNGSSWWRSISHDRRFPLFRRYFQRLLSFDGNLVPHLLPYTRGLTLVRRGHIHPISPIHAHNQAASKDGACILSLLLMAQRHMLQVRGKFRSRQASEVAEEDLSVHRPRQPAHRLHHDLGLTGHVFRKSHERLVVLPCASGE